MASVGWGIRGRWGLFCACPFRNCSIFNSAKILLEARPLSPPPSVLRLRREGDANIASRVALLNVKTYPVYCHFFSGHNQINLLSYSTKQYPTERSRVEFLKSGLIQSNSIVKPTGGCYPAS